MLDKKYRDEAMAISKQDLSSLPRTVGWESPSNIAVVKYWGKKGIQEPINPSISMTLSNMHTQTRIHYARARHDQGRMWLRFNGTDNHPFGQRIQKYIDSLAMYFPFLKELDLHIDTRNSFPHSAGMASSASAMSSLALAICSIEQGLREDPLTPEHFFQKASYMARLGSGSAARSIYGNYVEWGQHAYGSDEFAHPYTKKIREPLSFLHDSVLITSTEPKKMKSSSGHELMDQHPYRQARIEQALSNMEKISRSLRDGDFHSFSEVAEEEALSLHALMLSSRPGYTLLRQATIEIIDELKSFRQETGAEVTFTLDAGPNVHVLYPTREKERIREWMNQKLKPLCEDGKMLHDFTGTGPERLHNGPG